MSKKLVSINDLPPDGKDFTLDDQEIWQDSIKEFNMDCKILKPLKAKIFAQPVDEGVLVKGSLIGEVAVPCNRCTEDTDVHIDNTFSEYEEIPPESRNGENDGFIVFDRHAPMLDLARVAWEQFMLSLPVNPVCKDDCKGLCPQCGANRNHVDCDCETSAGDPRLAILRDLKIDRK